MSAGRHAQGLSTSLLFSPVYFANPFSAFPTSLMGIPYPRRSSCLGRVVPDFERIAKPENEARYPSVGRAVTMFRTISFNYPRPSSRLIRQVRREPPGQTENLRQIATELLR